MTRLCCFLLTLLSLLSTPAVEGNAAFWRSSLAAGTGPETFEILDGVGPMAEANRYQFSSKETEALSGLSYYGYRFYDPGLQRWLNPDPLGEAGGLNLYGFVGNNPLSQIDPYGLLGWSDFNPGLILDKDVHQGLLSLLQGSGTGVPLDPNSNRALLNDEGITPGRLVDEEGNSYNGGQLVGVAAGAVSAIVLAEVVDQFSPLDEVGGLIKGGKKVCKKAIRKTPKLLGPGTSFGAKIEGQLAGRGWTKDLVQSAIDNPARTVPWRDTRHLPGGGRMNDPATAYYSQRGGYVVRNDRTGDIIQVSDRTAPGWKAPWD